MMAAGTNENPAENNETTNDETATQPEERGRVTRDTARLHARATEEAELLDKLTDPRPRTRSRHKKEMEKATKWDIRKVTIKKNPEVTNMWLNAKMQHLVGDKPIHKLSNEYWKRATYSVRKLILKSRMGVLPAQDYDIAKNNKNHTGECPLCGTRKTVLHIVILQKGSS